MILRVRKKEKDKKTSLNVMREMENQGRRGKESETRWKEGEAKNV